MNTSYYPVMPVPAIIDNYGDRYRGYEILIENIDLDNFLYMITNIAREIRNILWDNDIVPVMIYPSLPVNNRMIILLVFDSGGVSEDKIKRILEKIPRIKKVKSITKAKKYGNVIFSDKMFYFNLLNSRWILIGPAFMKALIKELRSVIGNNVADILLLTLGKTIGEIAYNYYTLLGNFESISNTIGFLEMILSISGWGKIEGFDVRKDKIILTLMDLWECNILLDNNIDANPQLFKGVLSGFFSKVFNKEVNVYHVSTRRKNNSVYCVFEITR